MTAIGIYILLNTEIVLMFVLVIPTFHKYWATSKNMIQNINKESTQDIDDIVSFGMKIDYNAISMHIIVAPRYSTGLGQITDDSVVFSKKFSTKTDQQQKIYCYC